MGDEEEGRKNNQKEGVAFSSLPLKPSKKSVPVGTRRQLSAVQLASRHQALGAPGGPGLDPAAAAFAVFTKSKLTSMFNHVQKYNDHFTQVL